jgi:O-antigen/teichoic acid export membrane protein
MIASMAAVAASSHRRLFADALRILTSQAAGTAAAVIAGVVVVRALGPGGKGALAYATTAVTLATTAFGGITTAAMLAVARHGVDRSRAERHAFRLCAYAATATAVVLIAIGAIVHAQWALIGAGAALVPATYASAIEMMLQYRGDVRRAIVMRQISTTALALATAVVVVGGGGVIGAFACWAGALVVSALVGLRGLTATPGQAGEARIAGIGVATTALAIVAYLNLTVDVYIVAGMRTAVELGIYTVAIAAGEMLWHLSSSLLWPALSQFAKLERHEAARLAVHICRQTLAVVGGAAIAAWFAAPAAIRLVYGEAFEPSAEILRFVLPGIVAMAGEAVVGSYVLLTLGRPRTLLGIQGAATLACAVACVIGLPRFGLAAAALGTSVTYVGAFIAVVAIAARNGFPLQALVLGQRGAAVVEFEREDVADVVHRVETARHDDG